MQLVPRDETDLPLAIPPDLVALGLPEDHEGWARYATDLAAALPRQITLTTAARDGLEPFTARFAHDPQVVCERAGWAGRYVYSQVEPVVVHVTGDHEAAGPGTRVVLHDAVLLGSGQCLLRLTADGPLEVPEALRRSVRDQLAHAWVTRGRPVRRLLRAACVAADTADRGAAADQQWWQKLRTSLVPFVTGLSPEQQEAARTLTESWDGEPADLLAALTCLA
jgi:hypothetical protein